jgi:hypothetical protein
VRFHENELLPHFRERFFNFSKILKNLNKEYALKRLISRNRKLIEYPSLHGTLSIRCNKLILNILTKFPKVFS